jgi:hypothetical protein
MAGDVRSILKKCLLFPRLAFGLRLSPQGKNSNILGMDSELGAVSKNGILPKIKEARL